MNKTIYTLLAMLVASIGMSAAADDYLPLVREGVRWHYGYFSDPEGTGEGDDLQLYYEFKGDTIINGYTYKKLYRTITKGDGRMLDHTEERPPATRLECCMIEKDKVVYSVYEDGFYYWAPEEPGELGYKLYDFNQPKEAVTGYFMIQGKKCKQYATEFFLWEDYPIDLKLIEGFGYKFGADYLYSTLPYPYDPVPTCICGWYYVKFTDTEDNVLFDPENPIPVGVDDVKVAEVKGDDRYYNLQGQAVDIKTAPAGIYIHNGKKVVVK